MAGAIVNYTQAVSAAASMTLTLDFSPTANNLLFVQGTVEDQDVSTGPSGYTLIHNSASSGSASVGVWTGYKIAAGTETTLDFTFSGTNGYSVTCYEISGIDTSTPFDKYDLGTEISTVGETIVGDTMTPTASPSFMISTGISISPARWENTTVDNGFTKQNPDIHANNQRSGQLFGTKTISGASGTVTWTTTDVGDHGRVCNGYIFLEAAGGAPVFVPKVMMF